MRCMTRGEVEIIPVAMIDSRRMCGGEWSERIVGMHNTYHRYIMCVCLIIYIVTSSGLG